MNTTQMIEEKNESNQRVINMYKRWADSYTRAVARLSDAIEELPCCDQDCTCPALHLEGWSAGADNIGERFDITYTPSGNEAFTPVNEVRTAVCKALGTTLAKRSFTQSNGQIEFTIKNENINVTLKGATAAPNCEIVPVTKTVELTTFEMVCPDGEEPNEMLDAVEAKEFNHARI